MAEKKKKGRKGKYEEWLEAQNLELISGWCRNGLSVEQIAYNMCVSKSTLLDWKTRFPEIENAMKIGRDVADMMVENALFKRACGFNMSEVKETEGPKGKEIITIAKVIPGDVSAQMFWLKNRQPDRWKDKREEIITTDDNAGGVILVPEIKE